MLISMASIMKNYTPSINGVLHVGAHLAEESKDYKRAGVKHVVWVEANERLFRQLRRTVPSTDLVINAVVGAEDGKQVTFHTANNSQSSSILELGTHRTAHPEVEYVDSETLTMRRLDSLYDEYPIGSPNFMNLDIQGAELEALKGLGSHLDEFDYIYSEVNKEELYVGCCLISDLDDYLTDFKRVETSWTPFGWGDAFYVRA